MEANLPLALLIAAGLNGVGVLALVFRALHSRAGLWAILLGVLLGAACLGLGFELQGEPRGQILWWFSACVTPALFLPLGIAVANIGLLRQLVFLLNAALAILAIAGSYILYTQLTRDDAGAISGLPSSAFLYAGWAGAVWLAAMLDAILQWIRQPRADDKLRQILLILVLALLALGLEVQAYSLVARDLPQIGFLIASAGFWLLTIQLLIRPGPRRISGTVTPDILQKSSQAVIIADGDGRIQAVNNAAVALLARRRFQVLGSDLERVLGLTVEHLDTVTRLHGAGYIERIQIAIKAVKAVREVAVHPLVLRARNGEVLALVLSLHPGSEDPALSATSLLDPVTGLPGAALGEALIEQELRHHAGGSGPLVSAIFLRLDDTGVIATRHGQVLYERLQSSVTERLQAVCDWPVDLARTAGGGYVMVLTQVNDQQEVLQIADRAKDMLMRPYKIDQQELSPPVVVAVLPDLRVYHEIVDLLADARQALQQARHEAGGLYVADQEGKERISLALSLEAAIATDALDLRVEPVVDLRTQQAIGMRVGVQWAPEGMAAIDDAALRRLARRVHLEGPLNQWRLRAIANGAWPKGWQVFLPVDIEELLAPNFIKVFPKAATRLPFKITLELPDSAWMLPAAHKIAQELAAAGMGLHALDYSAGSRVVTHAAGLLPRSVSLGAALVQTVGPVCDAAIRGLAATAHAQGAAIRGEGLRKKSDLVRLRDLGVPLACGEYLAPEMSSDALAAWLLDESRLKSKFEGLPTTAALALRDRVEPRVD